MWVRWLAALALIPLLVTTALGPAHAGPDDTFTFEPGINRPGGDYDSFDLGANIAGYGPCESKCRADSKCSVWTYVKPGIQGPKARCWLKSGRPATVKDDCCISGNRIHVTGRPKPAPGSSSPTQTPPPPAQSSALGSKVLAYAVKQFGKCVDGKGNVRSPCPPLAMGKVGDGECTHLVRGALNSVGAKFTSGSYVWGTKVGTPYRPGDVIQLFNVKLVGPNAWWETSTQHSAIIESVNNNVLTVLEQNTWAESNTINRRYVTRGTIDLNWKLERGNYIVYRPAAAARRRWR